MQYSALTARIGRSFVPCVTKRYQWSINWCT
ncbi:unnamed protein product [Leptidea sinapis]|uniref:Uncharacterized protein n=1 Tax=Leptidea sinapis TaxID=189913 RepID=A0A5E4QV81_9NEOP|nr:unnamed protein product [Leptidea sinapis]